VKKNLILIGMMAVGKSTVGKIVAQKQGLKFIDTDRNIEKKSSMKISKIFKERGERFFRKEEEKEVKKSLQTNGCVIALGGGAFINKKIREIILENGISFWLDANLKTLIKRSKWNDNRPLIKQGNNHVIINQLYAKRKNIYKLANYKILCDGLTKDNIAKKVIELYEKH